MKITDWKVELLDTMGDDISVVNAARVSFHKKSYYMYDDDDPMVEYMSEKDQRLLKFLSDNGHIIPFAHCFLSFRIKAPIFIARHFGKHQVGLAWSEVSRRYVDEDPEFFLPKKWRKRASNLKQGSSDEEITKLRYNSICGEFTNYEMKEQIDDVLKGILYLYDNLLESGVCPEQARMILPQNMMTEWIWSGSLLAFIRVCNLRLDSHTQKETQNIAKEIAHHLDMRFPESWKVCKKFNENL